MHGSHFPHTYLLSYYRLDSLNALLSIVRIARIGGEKECVQNVVAEYILIPLGIDIHTTGISSPKRKGLRGWRAMLRS